MAQEDLLRCAVVNGKGRQQPFADLKARQHFRCGCSLIGEGRQQQLQS
jgi:hypothetical protein